MTMKNSSKSTSSLSPDYKKTLQFLEAWEPSGPWVLTAIHPDGEEDIVTNTFFPDDGTKPLWWFLEKYGVDRNLYFMVNTPTRPLSKKASRKDVLSMKWLHVDIDPQPGKDIKEEQSRIVELVEKRPKGIPEPTTVIFSGGGYQLFWRLKGAYSIEGKEKNYESAKLWNLELEELFGGDACHNVDRIMRLPGTINRPSKRKRDLGRKEALATLMVFNENIYDLNDFPRPSNSPEVINTKIGDTKIELSGNIKRLEREDLQKLPTLAQTVIYYGFDPDLPDRWPSRSEALSYIACEMVRCGYTDDEVHSVMTDPSWPISESILEKKPAQAQRQVIRHIQFAREREEDKELAEMNKKYAVIENYGGKCRIMMPSVNMMNQTHYEFMVPTEVKTFLKNKKKSVEAGDDKTKLMEVYDYWMSHHNRRSYRAVTFAPEGNTDPTLFNVWSGFAVRSKPGSCEKYLNHIFENICNSNKDHYEYLLNWMAHRVQFADRQAGIAVVLKGKQGTGKGVFAGNFGSLFGSHFRHVKDSNHIIGEFTKTLEGACLIFADEAFFAGNRKERDRLKGLISEDSYEVTPKGVNPYSHPNRMGMIIASNNDWIINADSEERRFFVLNVSPNKLQDIEYFDAITAEMRNGGKEALLYELLNRDLSDFKILNFPVTSALRQQQAFSLSPEKDWWLVCLREGELVPGEGWPASIASEHLRAAALDYTHGNRRGALASGTKFGTFIQEVCPKAQRKRIVGQFPRKKMNGEEVIVTNPLGFVLPSLDDCRKYWNENIDPTQVWNEPEHHQPTLDEPF